MIDIKKSDWDSVILALRQDENNPVKRVNARDVLITRRMDVIIRKLALNELLHNMQGDGISMYRKWLALSHGTNEATKTNPVAYFFSDYSEKSGFEQYCHSFMCLYESIKKNGFDSHYYIPLDCENNPMNGMHRLAAALYLDIDVYIKCFPSVKTGWTWNCGRLSAARFSERELFIIKREYVEITKNPYINWQV